MSYFSLKPIGALIFGYIGDRYGRKATVVITTMMMAISCVAMALMPTYAEKGIIATIAVIICRIVQGLSSMGEVVGTEIYFTESTKPPIQYPVVALATVFATVGTFAALGVAAIVTSFGFNWRIAFWIGAIIAVIGTVARKALRETPEFVDAKLRLRKIFEKANRDPKILENNPLWKEKINKKTTIALLIMYFGWPISFYLAYIHCGEILKTSFNYTPEQVIQQNFNLSIVELISIVTLAGLSYRVYTLKLLKIVLCMFTIAALACPYLLDHATTPFHIFIIQAFFMAFALNIMPAIPNCFRHFPVFKRFTYTTFIFALSRAFIYLITSFCIIHLTKFFGNWGLLVIMIPTSIGFGFGILHFEKLEKEAGLYPQKSLNNSSPAVA